MMTIGDFSRATRLSAKALRFYHRVGLLEPATVDPINQYRYYRTEQINDARVIHHLRSLDMPVEQVHRALHAPDADAKNRIIADHLRRMEQRLAQTQSSVESLRRLLAQEQASPVQIERREIPSADALVIRDTIDLNDLGTWFMAANLDLDDALAQSDSSRLGPRGGLWSTELFLDERGDCALFEAVPRGSTPPRDSRAALERLPVMHLAIATHEGNDATIGEVYADLGAYVNEHGIGAPGPVRESYLSGTPGGGGITEIGWPITT
ncbi:MerR family transcriptional regulator [Williamsia sp.]|uniref:MerR family transcriptional regulator n=1 Tax=Williamsia sp. TaxID=1872085 RepID=UPI002F9541C1